MAATDESLISLDEDQEALAREIHDETPVVDGLIPTDAYLAEEGYRDHLRQGGVNAANFTVGSRMDFSGATKELERYRSLVAEHSDLFAMAETAADIRAANEADRTGVVFGFQHLSQVEADLDHLRAFHRLGVRIVQLTYNSLNHNGAGCCERVDPGLSYFGRDFIDLMNERGMLLDLSHCADQTTLEAIEYSEDPVAFTHVCTRELSPLYGRNKTDEQIEAIADNGGIVCISFFPPLVKVDPESLQTREATVHDVIDHIDHVVDLVGVDHVGWGTDMNDKALDDGVTPDHSVYRLDRLDHPEVYGRGPTERYDPFPRGINRHTKVQNLTRGLVQRGYSDAEVRGIIGENFLRVAEEVWGE